MAYDNPHGLIAAAVVVQTLVLIMIGSRFVSHRKRGLSLSTSDWLIIAAGVLSTGLTIEQIYGMPLAFFHFQLAVAIGPLE
jgi:hypothetical protein